MRFLRAIGFICIFSFVEISLCVPCAKAADDSDWQEVRNHQPAALHLKLTLKKDHFFQGERIDATVDFSNDDSNKPYSVTVGAASSGAIFHATDKNGESAVDPQRWRYEWFAFSGVGLIANHEIGSYSLALSVNDSLRFDKPGVYKLHAEASVTEGTSFDRDHRGVKLVSDETSITIEPLTGSQEKEVISDALRKIGNSNSFPQYGSPLLEGIKELSYLQTPAARDALVTLLARHKLTQPIRDGLIGALDPSAVADRILELVKAGKLAMDDAGVEVYGTLKSYGAIRGISPKKLSEKERQKRFDELRKIQDSAKQEILSATVQASGGYGPAYIEALWAVFQERVVHRNPLDPDSDGGKARAAIAAHQLELSAEHVKELLNAWPEWGSPDFLPLVQREAGPPSNNTRALIALAGLQPDEAKSKIIEDLSSPDSKLLANHYPASTFLCAIPPIPLPQYDELFSDRLANCGGHPFPIIPVIGCFGSPALLPDVVKSYQAYRSLPNYGWDISILRCLFGYWLRCDPKGGPAAFEQEIQSQRGARSLLIQWVLRDRWTDGGVPAVQWALQSSDLELVMESISLLAERSNEKTVDQIIAAVERFRNPQDNARVSLEASGLLKSNRWHYTEEQKRRLQAMASRSKAE